MERNKVYLCRRCRNIFIYSALKTDHEFYEEIVLKDGNVSVPHNCSFGGIGVADLVGYETEKEGRKREMMNILHENNAVEI